MSEVSRPVAQVRQRARLLVESGRYDEAERQIRAGLAAAPDDPELLVLLAYLLRMCGRYAESLAVCAATVAVAPNYPDTYVERAECLLALRRGEAAVRAATEGVRLDPQEPRSYRTLARALAFEKAYDRAREAVQRALADDPDSVFSLLTLATVERAAPDQAAAEAAVRAALRRDPDNVEGRRLLALLHADRGRVDGFMRTVTALAADDPAGTGPLAMIWPVRRALAGPSLWLVAGASLLAVAAPLTAEALPVPATVPVRVVAALVVVVPVAFWIRLLRHGGRTPWRCLPLVSPLLRGALGLGLLTSLGMVGLLVGYAATGWWPGSLLALALVPVLVGCLLAEHVGANAVDPSLRVLGRWVAACVAAFWRWAGDRRRESRAARRKPGI
ncbi:tetratricopeptide repeat protein [Micromonospora sp. WMMD1102]|uniref:tetratricopeptide repeat protein n=1 Tax=Micromonospora sp. WMMD1102 TaxID=3016105 RepID=UPI002414D02F|nr:tetratricopeptide repeat protein [Micromonospora sp. WMMD1102]MDG4785789.1 tetratricopeptide repeat protein [Micromonospora sp. WMMD1102]